MPEESKGRYGAVTIWVDGLAVQSLNYADVEQARAAAERLGQHVTLQPMAEPAR